MDLKRRGVQIVLPLILFFFFFILLTNNNYISLAILKYIQFYLSFECKDIFTTLISALD